MRQVSKKGHTQLLIEKLGEVGCRKVHHFRKLRKGEIFCVVFLDQTGDLGDTNRVAVLLRILRPGALYTEIVVYHIHKIIDIRAITQLVALLLVSVVFNKAGNQGADGVKGGIVALYSTVTEEMRMQALANYETFRNYDLVKRCLYLFAGTMMDGGRIGACLFTEPEIEVDDTVMFDYSLFYIPTLLDYYKATGDIETLRELAPTARHQLEVVQPCFGENHLVKDSNVLGWCFVDWNLGLNKQASAQGIYLYCLNAAIEMAGILGMDTAQLEGDLTKKKEAAELLWNGSFYVSGENRQISWASQVWMTLGGAANGNAELLERLEQTSAEAMVTPYMYHNYIDALLSVGQKEKALQILNAYWGGMMDAGADTFWELYNPENPNESPYGGTIVNSYCHAWSCAPAYFLRKFFSAKTQ